MTKRCSWVKMSNPLYITYHDEEWGQPLHDDQALFELLCMETYQAGERMNLVTDQYIKTSFEDFNEKGYEGKLLGIITMQFILFLIFLFSIWVDSQNL